MFAQRDYTKELLDQQRNIALFYLNQGLENMNGNGASIYVIGMAELAEKLCLISEAECKWYSDTAIRIQKEKAAQRKAEYEAARKAVKK